MKFVALSRVSTDQQGHSGLGLAAQRGAMDHYAASVGGTIVGSFVEIESGTAKRQRPILDAAIQHCLLTGATLLIAKLDRMTRSLATLCRLRDAGVRFVAVDNPTATELTVNILISVAQEEAALISQRTRAALAKTTKVLGGYRGGPVPDAMLSVAARRKAADGFAKRVGPTIIALRQSGSSLAQIASKLSSDGILTARGGQWTPTAVRNVMLRLAA